MWVNASEYVCVWVSYSPCVAGSGYSPTVEGRRSVLAH